MPAVLVPGVRYGRGYGRADGEEDPLARLRLASPGLFGVLGVPLLAGRDFTDEDRDGCEPVAIVSQSVAHRMFSNGDALNRHMWWTDPYFGKPVPRRIVGVIPDVDDERVIGAGDDDLHAGPADGIRGAPVRARRGEPYALVPTVRRVIRQIA